MKRLLAKLYYRINNPIFKELELQKLNIKISSALSRGASTMVKRTIDPKNINTWEFSAFSQNGEDGIIDYLIDNLIEPNNYFIEIGASNCIDNNSAWLAFARNYSGLMIEGDSKIVEKSKYIKPWYVDYENLFVDIDNLEEINDLALFKDPDFFSLDIDGNDYYILEALLANGYRPKIIAVEYNSAFGPENKITIKYDKNFNMFSTHSSYLYYGVSLNLYKHLLTENNYTFIGVEKNGVNAFFIDTNCFAKEFASNISGYQFKENLHQLRKFKCNWEEQFSLISDLPFKTFN